MAKRAASEKKGFVDESGKDHFTVIKGKSSVDLSEKGKAKRDTAKEIAKDVAVEYYSGGASADQTKPFVGAQPKLLKHPEIATPAEAARATKVACKALKASIEAAGSVIIVFAHDAKQNEVANKLIKEASDDAWTEGKPPVTVSLGHDWMMTLPFVQMPPKPEFSDQLVIYVGTPGKYMAMCIRSDRGVFDKAYAQNRLVVVCKGAIMLPLGTQEQNIFGTNGDEVVDAIADALRAKGGLRWGHGAGTKADILQKSFGYASASKVTVPLDFSGDTEGHMAGFDYLVEYTKFLNMVKLAKPDLKVTNYYDTGLLVSVLMGCIAEHGLSLLVDRDGLAMLRDASIGHIISKLNQLIAVKPFSAERAVYNFYIGDGACRLNGGTELALHLIEGYKAESMVTLFIFNNEKWAIEDNLVAETEKEHVLYNLDFYDLIGEHDSCCICDNDLELRETVAFLSDKTQKYLDGKAKPGLSIVIVRGLNMELPPVIGDIDPIRKSPEMQFMRKTLGEFAAGCKGTVPIYGCSAFEYIQFLHIFMEEMPEGKRYQYVCGRTDIQAAHMCGFEQPEGKCVLLINDVYGINSLGESLRFVLSGFGGKQLLVMVWHPTLLKVIDHFHLHRPPMVWPSLGPELCKYYVRSEHDAFFADFAGDIDSPVVGQVSEAIAKKTPLVVVNVLPEQECNYISLDVRLKTQ